MNHLSVTPLYRVLHYDNCHTVLKNKFSELLKKLSAKGVAVLMATHDLFRAKESGTRVGILRHGKLMTTLKTEEIGHADLERIYLEHMND